MCRADGNPINVLVVDDEPVLAEMVSMALRYEGWNISTAGDGESAIAAARNQRPDVVVLDVMLPDMSGEWRLETAMSRVRLTGSFDLCADAVTPEGLVATAQTRTQLRFPAGPPRQKARLAHTSRARNGGVIAGRERAWQSPRTSSNGAA